MICESILRCVLEMSITATVLACIVIGLRIITKHLLPRSFMFALWIVVIAKLLIPLSIPSPTSLYNIVDVDEAAFMELEEDGDLGELSDSYENPAVTPSVPQVNIGLQTPSGEGEAIAPDNPTVPPIIPENDAPLSQAPSVEDNGQVDHTDSEEISSEAKKEIFKTAGAVYCGITAVVAVSIIGIYIVTACKIGRSEAVEDERVLGIMNELGGADKVKLKLLRDNRSIMIFGILRPTIILPEDYKSLSESELRYLLMHELEHYRHKDTLWNAVMLAAVCVHWFNPIVWLSHKLFICDMETACDARVLAKVGDEKHSFANVLLSFASRSIKGNTIATMGFVKSNLKDRLISAVKYKRTGVITIIVCVVLAIGIVAIFATSSLNNDTEAAAEETTDMVTDCTEPETQPETEETTETEDAVTSEDITTEPEEPEPEETETTDTESEETEATDTTAADPGAVKPEPEEKVPTVVTEPETESAATEKPVTTESVTVTEPQPIVVPEISYSVSQERLGTVNEKAYNYLWNRADNEDKANVQGQSPVWVIENMKQLSVATTRCGSNELEIIGDFSRYNSPDFFEDSVLCMIYVRTSNDTNVCAVSSVYFDGKELNIELNTEYSVYLIGEMKNKEETDWFVCVEINREAFEYAEAYDVTSSQNFAVYEYDYKNKTYFRVTPVGFIPHGSEIDFASGDNSQLWKYAVNTPDECRIPTIVIDSYARYIELMTDKDADYTIRQHLAYSIVDASFFEDNVLIITGGTLPDTGYIAVSEMQVVGDTLYVNTKQCSSPNGGFTVLTKFRLFDSLDRETYSKIKNYVITSERVEGWPMDRYMNFTAEEYYNHMKSFGY